MDKKERDRLWRINNKDKIRAYNQSIDRKAKEKERYELNRKPHNKKKEKDAVDNLKNSYVVNVIKNRTGVPRRIISQHPEWIEAYREQIKLKRLIKIKKNDSN